MISSITKLINSIYPSEIASRVMEHLISAHPRPSSFRLTSRNTSLDTHSALTSLHLNLNHLNKPVSDSFHSVPWFSSAFTVDHEVAKHDIKHLDAVKNGFIYFQSLTSMLPALCLDVEPGMGVLDLCAAPGSKTTLIASLLNGRGSLVAVEKDWIRMQRLIHNVRLCTSSEVESTQVHEEDPQQVATRGGRLARNPTLIGNVTVCHSDGRYFRAGPFDRVLVDAPCSGSGRLHDLRDAPAPIDWKPEVVQRHVARQKALLLNGCSMLKKGGILVYSTCSLSKEENEGVVQWLLDNNHDLMLCDLTLNRRLMGNGAAAGQGQVEGSPGGVRRVVESGPMKLREALLFDSTSDHQRSSPTPPQAHVHDQQQEQGLPFNLGPLPPPPNWNVMSGISHHSNPKAMDKTMRLLPSMHFEGFFIAKIKKK